MYLILKLSSLFLIGFSSYGFKRVNRVILKEDSALRIYLSAGRISVLQVPCEINKVLVGSPNDLSVSMGKKEIHLLLKKWKSQPTNLLVKCKKSYLIFDIVPSKITHNDLVEVLFQSKIKHPQIKSFSHYKSIKINKSKDIKKILKSSWRIK